MHELATEIIQKKNEELIDASIYEKQKQINPKGCIHYLEGTKCHNLEKLYCFFCFCPKYDRTIKEGGCKNGTIKEEGRDINPAKGKYIDTKEGKILGCSDCILPHKRDNAIKLLDNLFTNNDIILS